MHKLEELEGYKALQQSLMQARERRRANEEYIEFLMAQINTVKREFYQYELDRQI